MNSTKTIPPLFRALVLRLERVNQDLRSLRFSGDEHAMKIAARRRGALVSAILALPLS